MCRILLESANIEIAHDAQDIESFRKGTLCQCTMADERGAQYRGIKVVLFVVGGILSQGLHFPLDILLADFHQEMGEEAIAAAQGIKPQHGGTAEGAQHLLGGLLVILVNIRAGVGEDDIGLVFVVEAGTDIPGFPGAARGSGG